MLKAIIDEVMATGNWLPYREILGYTIRADLQTNFGGEDQLLVANALRMITGNCYLNLPYSKHTLSAEMGNIFQHALPTIHRQIITDNNTRQAVIRFLEGFCTQMVQFLFRNGELNLVLVMRSSDTLTGLPYDIFGWTAVTKYLSILLKCDLGMLYYFSGSQHLWTTDAEPSLKHKLERVFRLQYNIVEQFLDVLLSCAK
jgi:hypothetical protein